MVHMKIEPCTSARNSSRPRAGGREEAARFSWPGLRHPASGCSMFLSRTNACIHNRVNELWAMRTFAFESCTTYVYRLTFFSSAAVSLIFHLFSLRTGWSIVPSTLISYKQNIKHTSELPFSLDTFCNYDCS